MTFYFSTILFGAIFAVFITWLCIIKFGFLSQKPGHYSNQGTEFDIRERLCGDMICEGVIYGPFGKVNTRFVAYMHAKWEGDVGHMTESFTYDNGDKLERIWDLKVMGSNGIIEATAPDIIGIGAGKQSGSGVRLCYKIKLPKSAGGFVLNTVDWLYLMENGTIINRSQFRKFGIKVGELVANMRKIDT